MEVDFVIRGYPSRVRFADWQVANTLPDDQLTLTPEQAERARKLYIPERAYAVGVKAAELARSHAVEKMEEVAQCVGEAIARRYPEGELRSIVWDFMERKFRFVIWHRNLGREYAHSVPGEAVDDFLLGKESAEAHLREQVDSAIGGELIDALAGSGPVK